MIATAIHTGQKVSIIVLTHNQLSYTKICLESLITTNPQHELILVDNGSDDGTYDHLVKIRERWGSKACKVIRNEKNAGGCAARNQAVRMSSGDILLFLDNDVYSWSANWADDLVQPLICDRGCGAVGPMLAFPPDGTIIQSAGGGTTAQGHFGLLGRGQVASIENFHTRKLVSWLPAACLACRRETFDLIGGFDESLDPISLGEDIDLCFKIHSLGCAIIFDPTVRLLHFEGSTFNNSKFSYNKKQAFINNIRIIRRRWRSHFPAMPLATDEQIRYYLIRKNYTNLKQPIVAVDFSRLGSFSDPNDGR
jgi:GT2 family glycosyltransferase